KPRRLHGVRTSEVNRAIRVPVVAVFTVIVAARETLFQTLSEKVTPLIAQSRRVARYATAKSVLARPGRARRRSSPGLAMAESVPGPSVPVRAARGLLA